MNKLSILKSRRSLLIMVVCVLTVLAVAMPMAVAGQTGYPNLYGFYFGQVKGSGADIDGLSAAFPHRYLGVLIGNNTTDDEGVIGGYIFGFNTTSVKGARAQGDTRTYNATIVGRRNRQALDFGINSVNVTATGLLGVYIPRYCEGAATDDEGEIEGGTVELEYGWNSVNVTVQGAIDVAVWMSHTDAPMGEVVGIVGEGTAARFVIYSTDIVTDLDDTEDDVLVGVAEASLITGETAFVVDQEATGNITVYMPYGTEGTLTADDCTVDGKSSIELEEGTNVILVADNDADGGTITFDIQTLVSFHWSGRVTGRAGDYRLSGNFNWYNLPETLVLSGKLNARNVVDSLLL